VRSVLSEVNNFVLGNRRLSETDVKLAEYYFPILIKVARDGGFQSTISFLEFIREAQAYYPEIEIVQKAIPVSTGRRFEALRLFLRDENLPDLSAFVVNAGSGRNSADYVKDFDPILERKKCAQVAWERYLNNDWIEYAAKLLKSVVKLDRRTGPVALTLMGQITSENRELIRQAFPSNKKEPLYKLLSPYRLQFLKRAVEGEDPHDLLEDLLKEIREDYD